MNKKNVYHEFALGLWCPALYTVGVILLFTVTCQSAQAQEIIELEHARSAVLGGAYDKQKEAFVGSQCVTGDPVPTGASQSSLSLDQSMSEETASNSLGFSVGARARYGVVEGSMSANFLSRSASTDFSVSSIYSAEYTFQKDKLPVPKLNTIGEGVSGNYERWPKTCGTQYVDEIRKGGKFFFSIKIDFSSRQEKEQFDASFKIEGPAAGVNTTLQQASEHFSRKTKVTVSVYQYGGDIERVSGIFANSADARQSYVQCSLGHFDACADVLQSALAYATDVDKGFPSQLKDPSKRSTLSYDVTDYAAAGLYKEPPPGLAQLVLLKREELAKTFEIHYRRRKLTDAILNTSPGPPRLDQLRQTAKLLDSNLKKIVAASTVCYEDPKSCPDAVDSVALEQINTEVFALPYFWEFCQEAYVGGNRILQPTIVGLLLGQPGFDPSSNRLPDFCYDPTDTSHASTVGSISGLGSVADLDHNRLVAKYPQMPLVTDVSPLQSGAELTSRVFLGDNNVESIDALALLPGLSEVDIANNHITDLRPLGMCKRLYQLVAPGNQISDLAPLANLNELTQLYLSNNVISDLTGIEKLPRLEILNLSKNQIADIKTLTTLPELRILNVNHNLIRSLKGFTPPRLQQLDAEENQFSTEEVLEFCKKVPTTSVTYTGEDGQKKIVSCRFSNANPQPTL